MGSNVAVCPTGRIPIGTCKHYEKLLLALGRIRSHSVGPFCQRLDHKILIIVSPSPHCHTRGRIHDISNVVLNVRFLSAFIVQGNRTERQRLDDSSDVDLRATGCTNVKLWEVKVDEFLHELEDLAARRWDPGRGRTFVERVKDNEDGGLLR